MVFVIQNSNEINNSSYEIYTLDKYLFIFDINIKYEKYQYQCKWYYGITFLIENDGDILNPAFGRYDVIHNINMGNRLLINNKRGWKDIPFHQGTFGFLPEGIKVLLL